MGVRLLSDAQALELWERARRLDPARRAVAFALAAWPDASFGSLAAGPIFVGPELTLGRCNALILALYRLTFGDAIRGYGRCPGCATWVRFEASCTALLARDRPGPRVTPLTRDGYLVFWRIPTTVDEGLVSSVVGPDGEWADPADLPVVIGAAVAERVRECDPLAEIEVRLSCADCDAMWEHDVSPAAVFFAALSERADRLLDDARTLAIAHGWTRTRTLACPEPRRRALVNLVRAEHPPAWPPPRPPTRP